MADLHMTRDHHLDLAQARELAHAWAERAEREFGVKCVYTQTEAGDQVRFERAEFSGTLRVTGRQFELKARLGLLLSAFKDKIEAGIVRNLERLLAEHQAQRQADKRSGLQA